MFGYSSSRPYWLDVVLTTLFVIIALSCIFSLLVSVIAPRGVDGAADLWGHELRIITTNSMEECELTDVSEFEIKSIPTNSMVFVEKLPEDEAAADEWYSTVKVGDVLVIRYTYVYQETIVHRVTSIKENDDGGYTIELAGDNKSSDETMLYQTIDTSDEMSTNYVIGRVTGQSRFLGAVIGTLQRFVKSMVGA